VLFSNVVSLRKPVAVFQHVSPAKEPFGSRTFDLGEGKSG